MQQTTYPNSGIIRTASKQPVVFVVSLVATIVLLVSGCASPKSQPVAQEPTPQATTEYPPAAPTDTTHAETVSTPAAPTDTTHAETVSTSREEELQATIAAMETAQVATETPTPSPREEELLATIAAMKEGSSSPESTEQDPTTTTQDTGEEFVEIASGPTTEDTPPGTILEEGQTWRQGGAEMTLKSVSIGTDALLFYFSFTNQKTSAIAIKYTEENFTATDNKGRKLGLEICPTPMYCTSTYVSKSVVGSGETEELEEIDFYVDATDPSITEVVMTVSNISTITEARWRVAIEH